MFERIIASCMTAYAVWHAYKHARRPRKLYRSMRALQRERIALQREQIANQQRMLTLSQQGPEVLAAVIAATSGDIGGKVGLGYQTPGYAGNTARY